MKTEYVENRINRMLKEGYLPHTIAAALGWSERRVVNYIDRNALIFSKCYKLGIEWRQEHPMTEWPDYVWGKTLVGKKSKWFDKLADAKTIIVPEFSPVTNFDYVEQTRTMTIRRPTVS